MERNQQLPPEPPPEPPRKEVAVNTTPEPSVVVPAAPVKDSRQKAREQRKQVKAANEPKQAAKAQLPRKGTPVAAKRPAQAVEVQCGYPTSPVAEQAGLSHSQATCLPTSGPDPPVQPQAYALQAPGAPAVSVVASAAPTAPVPACAAPEALPVRAASDIEARRVPRVPAYLKKRQAELAEEKRRALMPPPQKIPDGYRLVSEDERIGTVEVLQQRRAEVERALNSLPFKIETLGQRRREADLTGRLGNLEKLLVLFGNPTVFVPADAESISTAAPKSSLGGDSNSDAQSGGADPRRGPKQDPSLPGLHPAREMTQGALRLGKAILEPPGGRSKLILY